MDDKFISPCKPPEGLERELLTMLAEECAEVTKRVTKALRFGTEEVQPCQNNTNAQRIEIELGDIEAVCDRLEVLGLISRERVLMHAGNKQAKLDKYLQSAITPPLNNTQQGE